MAAITPSMVVKIIDQHFPWAVESKTPNEAIGPPQAAAILAITDLADRIPSELLASAGDDYALAEVGSLREC